MSNTMTTTERPTPETDQEEERFNTVDNFDDRVGTIPADFARRLERERDEAREQHKHLISACDGMLEIVEGVRSDRWHYDGFRLKVTSEWVNFYVSARKAEAKGNQ